MNGAFFGTKKVIANFVNMISCKRTRHGGCSKCMMIAFMVYLVSLYALQFFIVGAMFASIYSFFDQLFSAVTKGNWGLEQLYESGLFSLLFAYLYIFLIIMTLILSLALPLEKAKAWFMIVLALFSVLTLISVVGIIFYLKA